MKGRWKIKESVRGEKMTEIVKKNAKVANQTCLSSIPRSIPIEKYKEHEEISIKY